MMEYRSAILDECGSIMCWCSSLTEDEVDTLLSDHPEWYVACVLVN